MINYGDSATTAGVPGEDLVAFGVVGKRKPVLGVCGLVTVDSLRAGPCNI